MKNKKIYLIIAITTLLTSCSNKKSEQDTIADAQACLDAATQATASTCMDKVSGLTSKGADLIRCVSLYLTEGFTDPNRMSSALSSISGGSGSSNSVTMMSTLAFKADSNSDTNLTNARSAQTYCAGSGSKGLTMLSSLTTIATAAYKYAALSTSTNLSPSDLSSIASSPEGKAIVGNAAIAAYNSSCTNGAQSAGAFCQQFGSAVSSGSSAEAIGNQLVTCYATPSASGCTGF
jgi:hypothetical protein